MPPSQMEPIVETLSRELEGNHRVLEVGVGTGRFAIRLQENGINVLGVDVSPRMLARGREKGLSDGILADALHLPLKNKSVDATFSVQLLPFIEDWRGALREIARVTQKAYYTIATHSVREDSPFGFRWKSLREAGEKVFSLLNHRSTALKGTARLARNAYYEIANYYNENRSPGGLYWRFIGKAGYMEGMPGIKEQQLQSVIQARKRVLIGTFVTYNRPVSTIEALSKRAYSAQWSIPEDVHLGAMKAVARGSFEETTRVKTRFELLEWDVTDLSPSSLLEPESWHAHSGNETPGVDEA